MILYFNRHNTRKNLCHKTKPNEDQNITQNNQNILKNNLECECGKILSNQSNFTRHKKTCKGVNSLTCPNCKVKFITSQSKHYHLKKRYQLLNNSLDNNI